MLTSLSFLTYLEPRWLPAIGTSPPLGGLPSSPPAWSLLYACPPAQNLLSIPTKSSWSPSFLALGSGSLVHTRLLFNQLKGRWMDQQSRVQSTPKPGVGFSASTTRSFLFIYTSPYVHTNHTHYTLYIYIYTIHGTPPNFPPKPSSDVTGLINLEI